MPAPDDGHVIRLGADGSPTAIPESRTTRLLPRRGAADFLSHYREGLAAPIEVDGRPWGSLTIVSAEAPIGAEAERALIDFADLVRLAISDAEQRRRIAEYAAEQAALRRAATLSASDADPDEVLALVCQEAAQLLGLRTAAVVRLGDGRHSEIAASWREDELASDAVRAWLAPGGEVASGPDRGWATRSGACWSWPAARARRCARAWAPGWAAWRRSPASPSPPRRRGGGRWRTRPRRSPRAAST